MTAKLHAILQAIALAIQGINIATLTGQLSFLPPKVATWLLFIVAALQAIAGLANHFFNPDGTPAQSAWKSTDSTTKQAGRSRLSFCYTLFVLFLCGALIIACTPTATALIETIIAVTEAAIPEISPLSPISGLLITVLNVVDNVLKAADTSPNGTVSMSVIAAAAQGLQQILPQLQAQGGSIAKVADAIQNFLSIYGSAAAPAALTARAAPIKTVQLDKKKLPALRYRIAAAKVTIQRK